MVERNRSLEELQSALSKSCGELTTSSVVELGDLVITVQPEALPTVLRRCKEDAALAFNLLVDITAVDWMDSKEVRFELVYQLLSLSARSRLTIKVPVSEDAAQVESAVPLWNGANFLEREVWDMFGIRFNGHPDLRRILMYEEFVGHPLRKDYPVQGKQPRIPLRAPEVENTARNMQRPELVSIRSRRVGGEQRSA
jgi:NADH-quinone oxidoreductase subunit C